MVCPVPNWEGSEFVSKPFLGVRTFFQPAKAKNPTLASTFLNDDGDDHRVHGRHVLRRPAAAGVAGVVREGRQPIRSIKGFGDYGATGIPMPTIPQMGNVFADVGLAEYKIASGEDPTPTMDAGRRVDQQGQRRPRLSQGGTAAMTSSNTAVGGAGGRHALPLPGDHRTDRQARPRRAGRRPAHPLLRQRVDADWWLAAAFFVAGPRRRQLRLLHRPGAAAEVPAARAAVPDRVPAVHDGVHRLRLVHQLRHRSPRQQGRGDHRDPGAQSVVPGAGRGRRTPSSRSSRTARSRC